MKKLRFAGLLVVAFFAVLITMSNASAQSILYASTGGVNQGADNAGAILIVDQGTGAVTALGTPLPGWGLPGLDFDSHGRLFAVTNDETGNSKLLRVNPTTGALISNVGDLMYQGDPITMQDVSFQPGTDILFGMTANSYNNPIGGNKLVTINTSTAVVTLVGDPAFSGGSYAAIAFAPDGTLYSIRTGSGYTLYILSPVNGSVVSSTPITPGVNALGMDVRPADGLIFLSECCGVTTGNDLYTVDPGTGADTLVGSFGGTRRIHDLAFYTPSAAVPTIGEWGALSLSIVLTALAVWAVRLRRKDSVAGPGRT